MAKAPSNVEQLSEAEYTVIKQSLEAHISATERGMKMVKSPAIREAYEQVIRDVRSVLHKL